MEEGQQPAGLEPGWQWRVRQAGALPAAPVPEDKPGPGSRARCGGEACGLPFPTKINENLGALRRWQSTNLPFETLAISEEDGE